MKAFYLYVVILLEGYVVLSTELVAIRQLVPFVGSGTEVIAIVIAAVLMPLSAGYYIGGNFKSRDKKNRLVSIRKKLIRNLVVSSAIILVGISYALMEIYFGWFKQLGIRNGTLQASIYSLVFLVYPVFLLGQTVPLISNYFRGENLSKSTGTILTFSTIGSFLGATLSTLVLMVTIGVHNVIIVNLVLLFIAVVILSKSKFSTSNVSMAFIICISFVLNGESMMKSMGVVEDNNYSIIKVLEGDGSGEHREKGTRMLDVNRSFSAKFSDNPELRLDYLKFIEKRYVDPIANRTDGVAPKSILVVGAGGFTFGQDDSYNDYTFIDIDASLKKVVEEHFFKREIKENHKFLPIEARAFFNQTDKKYDLIFLDAYSNVMSIPQHLVTKEFFQQVKSHLNENGIVLFNAITSSTFEDKFSVKLDNTFRQVFPLANRQPILQYDGWNQNKDDTKNSNKYNNVIYSYHHRDFTKDNYTDNINTYFLDRR